MVVASRYLELIKRPGCFKCLVSCRFRDGYGLQFLLTTQMQDLMKSQKTVQDAVKSLEGPASKEVIEEATVCHLRPMRLPLNKYVVSISLLETLKWSVYKVMWRLYDSFSLCYITLLCKYSETYFT